MEESASNLINFYTNRIEELKTQLTKSNNKIEKIKEYVKDNGFGLYTRLCNGDTNIDLVESVEKDILSIIDGSDE